ncbi:MAG TPA: hypothetical protein VI387_01915 [Candidatus Brocadiales bacterium]|nr:hypothetical protein [Candidatus Brocadiales bacterium]
MAGGAHLGYAGYYDFGDAGWVYIGIDEYYFRLACTDYPWFSGWYHFGCGHAVFGDDIAVGFYYFGGERKGAALFLILFAGENDQQ